MRVFLYVYATHVHVCEYNVPIVIRVVQKLHQGNHRRPMYYQHLIKSAKAEILLLPKSYTPLLYKLIKTDLFQPGWTGSAFE